MAKSSTKVTEGKVSDLVFDDKNFNKGTEYGKALIDQSVERFGAGRSVVVDKNMRLMAGNKFTEAFGEHGGEDIVIVETTGDKLVVVKRTDMDLDTKEGRDYALADNATAKADLAWDTDVIGEVQQELGIEPEDWGVQIGDDEQEQKETEKLSKMEYNSCYYEPKNVPDLRLEDCVNMEKFDEKMKALDEYELTDEERRILGIFACRFIKIDFEMVANYYAFNAREEEKKAMERLRLVLVDNGLKGFIEDDLLKVAQTIEEENECE